MNGREGVATRRRVRVERGVDRQTNGKYAVCFMLDGRPRFRSVEGDLDAARSAPPTCAIRNPGRRRHACAVSRTSGRPSPRSSRGPRRCSAPSARARLAAAIYAVSVVALFASQRAVSPCAVALARARARRRARDHRVGGRRRGHRAHAGVDRRGRSGWSRCLYVLLGWVAALAVLTVIATLGLRWSPAAAAALQYAAIAFLLLPREGDGRAARRVRPRRGWRASGRA
jgi:hypothetical protein